MLSTHRGRIIHLPLEVGRGGYFHGREVFFAMKYFFGMYSPLALDVYNRLFVDSLGLMAVDTTKKHMLGLTQSKYLPWPSVLTHPVGR